MIWVILFFFLLRMLYDFPQSHLHNASLTETEKWLDKTMLELLSNSCHFQKHSLPFQWLRRKIYHRWKKSYRVHNIFSYFWVHDTRFGKYVKRKKSFWTLLSSLIGVCRTKAFYFVSFRWFCLLWYCIFLLPRTGRSQKG